MRSEQRTGWRMTCHFPRPPSKSCGRAKGPAAPSYSARAKGLSRGGATLSPPLTSGSWPSCASEVRAKPWRLHDIRRTVATRMADLGVQPHVIEAVLNHISGHKAGVAGVYNRATYAAEKRQALDLWGAHVADLAEGRESNIVPLRGAR